MMNRLSRVIITICLVGTLALRVFNTGEYTAGDIFSVFTLFLLVLLSLFLLLPKNGRVHTLSYFVRDEVYHLKYVEPVVAQLQAMGYEMVDVKIAPRGFGLTNTVLVLYR